MKAIGITQSLPIDSPDALVEVELDQPVAEGHDLLIKVQSIAVNPVDYKVRKHMPPEAGTIKILGWDAVGEVIATGENVRSFQRGDQVYYAGDITRNGSNAEYQLVDERIVGHKPKSLSSQEAAALPLTTITAWELLFDQLNLTQHQARTAKPSDEVLLIVGAAGGVGSILIQLAKVLTGATVIATASRTSSQQWVKSLGADIVIDHKQALLPQIKAHGINWVSHIASLNGTESHFPQYIELAKPFSKIALIDDLGDTNIEPIKSKSLSLHWEFMFARSMHHAPDMIEQQRLLNQVANLFDSGYLNTTVGEHYGQLTVENLRKAHRQLESGTTIGKIVLDI